MKKTLLFILGSLMSLSAFAGDYALIAWSDTAQAAGSSYEAEYLAAIEALPQVDYIDIINSEEDWLLFLEDASNFEEYAAVIICESGSSSKSDGWAAINYPIPTVLLEPYVMHKSSWAWYEFADGMLELHKTYGFSADRFVEVIEEPEHPIFTGFNFSKGDEVTFAEGEVEADAGSYANNLYAAIPDVADNATPLAKNKDAVTNGADFQFNMWAIEENATTPRIFLWGFHANDLITQHDEMFTLMKNATLWVMGEEIVDATGVEEAAVTEMSAKIVGDALEISGVDVAQVTVYSLTGANVLTATGASTISVAGLADGIYMISVVDAAGAVSTAKVLK